MKLKLLFLSLISLFSIVNSADYRSKYEPGEETATSTFLFGSGDEYPENITTKPETQIPVKDIERKINKDDEVAKLIQEVSTKPLIYGLSSAQGKRKTFEDAHRIEIFPEYAFFGIFDGHGVIKDYVNRDVADFVAQNLLEKIIKNTYKMSSITDMIENAFIEVNQDLKKQKNIDSSLQGSTAVIAFILNNLSYIAHCGDSRAVFAYKNGKVGHTTDHKPENETEKKRIAQAGGFVLDDRINGDGPAMSRGFGDFEYEDLGFISKPEILKVSIEKYDFIILACDGIWDYISNEKAVKIVKSVLANKDKNYQDAAIALKDEALKKGGGDNITVMVINLQAFKK